MNGLQIDAQEASATINHTNRNELGQMGYNK